MPSEATILGISGAVWLRILLAAAVGIFLWRMARLTRVLRLGSPENRFDQLPLRLRVFCREVMGQARMFAEPVIGWAHPVIFWGFCLFVVASALLLLGGMFPTLQIPQVEHIPVLGTLVDLFAVLVIVGLVAAALRRYLWTPEGLQRTRDASLILVLIAALMLTFLLMGAGAYATGQPSWLPASGVTYWLLAHMGLSEETIAAVADVAWWVHVVVLLGFLVYLPFSKHMHLLWAPLAVFTAELPAKGTLPPVDAEAAAPTTPLGGFTWRMLLNAYSCAECGRCERACPAVASGAELSPREMVHRFKDYVFAHGLGSPGAGHGNGNGNGKTSRAGRLAEAIPPQVAWGCTTCYACMDVCPVRNEHVPLLVQVRRQLVDEGAIDGQLQETLTALQRYGNSLGKSSRKRFEWAKDLPVPLVDCQKQPVDLLWFVGDYACYHPSAARASRLVAQLLQQAGADFGVLLKSERSAGNDVRRVGEEGLFEMLAEQNMKAFAKAQFKRIVTTDPHTYHTLKHEYTRFGLDRPVEHYSEILDDYLRSGRLTPQFQLAGRAVYHDPCYLGRINGIYAPPRRVLDAIGIDRVELPRHGEHSFCCGGGGGKLWMEEEPGAGERPAVLRIREALAIDGVRWFVVACPKDLGMFEDAVKTVGGEDRLHVVDLAELVFEAVSNRPHTGTKS